MKKYIIKQVQGGSSRLNTNNKVWLGPNILVSPEDGFVVLNSKHQDIFRVDPQGNCFIAGKKITL